MAAILKCDVLPASTITIDALSRYKYISMDVTLMPLAIFWYDLQVITRAEKFTVAGESCGVKDVAELLGIILVCGRQTFIPNISHANHAIAIVQTAKWRVIIHVNNIVANIKHRMST